MKTKTILVCLIAALALSACAAGKPPVFHERGGNNCHRQEGPDLTRL